jgi:acyl transferase domain-containing protein/thioesterase domain-containing protein
MRLDNQNNASLLADSLAQIRQLRQQLEAIEDLANEPIAVIGLDCRFPGGIEDDAGYWEVLSHGIDCIGEIPAGRWQIDNYYDPDPDKPGKMYTRHGGFLEGVDLFEPQIFGISPLEASAMDPQQRLLLEVSYCALERSGYSPDSLKGSKTGVFVGICFDDYARVSLASNPENIEAFTSLGISKSVAVGRISHTFGFQGPAVSLDTSCSSSLLAIHLACQSLLQGESDLAVAGGVNLILAPDVSIGFCKLRALSQRGQCRTFDAAADGYVRGEGCGLVVLKRLSDALSDRDNILALVRGSAANNDGHSNGLTAPNGLAQERVIAQALKNATVQPSEIQYVEAHGTGTVLGDPIEVMALAHVLGQGRSKENPLFIGSVKTNFGHLEGAAGVAAFIKVVLSLQHRAIPPHLNFQTPNPYISWDKVPLAVPRQLTPWPENNSPRLAGVSSFGMSGTNVHAVLEEAPALPPCPASEEPQLLLLSARCLSSLERSAASLANYLRGNQNINLADVAFTLIRGRKSYQYCRVLVASRCSEAANLLAGGKDSLRTSGAHASRVAFLFSGQGTQVVNMGLDLYTSQEVFRREVDLCSQLLKPILGLDLRSLLYPQGDTNEASTQLNQTAFSQPALFVVEYALTQLWNSLGIQPQAALGHSLGEYVAACLAGVFSVEDALFLVALRGRLMQQMPKGNMLAIALPETEVLALVATIPGGDSLSLAAVNAPAQCVVSGPVDLISRLQDYCVQAAITCRLLHTSHAFHSSMMEPIVEEFRQHVATIQLSPPQLPYISNVTGTWISAQQACSPDYWAAHLRSCVRFADGLQQLSEGNYLFLEVGPGQTLCKLVSRQNHGENRVCFASLPNSPAKDQPIEIDTSVRRSLLETVGQFWLAGVNVDWDKFYSQQERQRLSLPTYSFERKRYWIDAPIYEHQPQAPDSQQDSLGQSRPLSLSSSYVAPRNALEESLVQIFASNLYIYPIGIDDNFFELGGDSLLAIQMTARLSQMFEAKLNQSQLVETPTIRNLSSIIQQNRNNSPTTASSLVELQSGTCESPLFFIHPAGGSAFCYRGLVPYFASNRPIYGVEDPAFHRTEKFSSFPEKAHYYINLIRQVQPEGPYFLAGYSYGGNMAWEMAVQLQQQGQDVKYLGLLDSFPSVSYENIAIDDTRLLSAVWYMTALIFEKKPRQWHEELKQVEIDSQLDYVVQQLLADPTGIPLSDAFIQPHALQVAMDNFRELHYYVPANVFTGEIVYFWAEEKIPHGLSELLNYQIPEDLITDGWGKLTTQPVKNYNVPGHHFTMFNESNIGNLAAKLLNSLSQH